MRWSLSCVPVVLAILAIQVQAFRFHPVRGHHVGLRHFQGLKSTGFLRPEEFSTSRMELCASSGESEDQVAKRSRFAALFTKLRRYAAGLMTLLIISCSIGVRGASARPSRRSAASRAPQIEMPVNDDEADDGSVMTDEQPVKRVDIELRIDDDADRSKQLSKIGFALVGATTLITLLTGNDGKVSKKKKQGKGRVVVNLPKRSAPIVEEDGDDDVDSNGATEDLFTKPSEKMMTMRTSSTTAARLKKGLSNLSPLPSPDELFGDDDSDSIFGQTVGKTEEVDSEEIVSPMSAAKSTAAALPKLPRVKMPPRRQPLVNPPEEEKSAITDDNDDDSLFAPSMPEPVVSKPEPVAVSKPSPPPPVAKKNIFDRIFQKQTSNRPTDLTEVMRINDASTEFRSATATILSSYASTSLGDMFDDVRANGLYSYVGGPVPSDVTEQANLLVQLKNDAGLDSKEVAEAFADVANAMLVSLSDRCVEILDNKVQSGGSKMSNEEIEFASATAVATLADFALSAADVFGKALPGVFIENGGIKYNGKAKKNKLETLFFNFMKAGSGMDSIKSMLGSAAGADGADGENTEAMAKMEQDASKKDARMGCLQHIFSISEQKRTGFEQKLMKDMIMGMMKGEGGMEGMGDLSKMMESFAGPAGAGGAGMNDDFMKEMMAGMPPGGGMPGGGGDMPDMDPAQMASMLSEAVRDVKLQLEQGTVSKEEIKDLEKQMGMDLSAVVNMMKLAKNMGGANKIDGIDDIIDVFTKLNKLKK